MQSVIWADVTYFRPDSPLIVPVSHIGNVLSLDLDFNNVVDITLRSNGATFDSVPQGNNKIIALIPPPPDMGSWIIPLEYGTQIDDAPESPGVWEGAGTTPAFASCMNVGCIGLWLYPNADAYFGLRFDIDGETHYGWVHVINTYGISGEVVEWGYELLPDTGLLAGVVPEPSTVLLFLGGVGILAFRRQQMC